MKGDKKMDLTTLKTYLRIDHDFDDAILTMLQSYAEEYIVNAVDSENLAYKENVLFDFAVTLLVGHWYEQRIASTDVALQEIPFGVTPLINQLRGLVE
ncbi:head-tail connector protein [Bacillus smithii]|uniref:head-tail connector protein n=1 Tax=Bacillus smithii TaxID=1479 RepID=UPI003D1A4350